MNGMKKVTPAADHAPMKGGWPGRFDYFVRDNIHNDAAKTYNGKSMALGGGGRFAKLKDQLSSKPGVTDPGALAAAIGRKKYGAKKFNALSHGGM